MPRSKTCCCVTALPTLNIAGGQGPSGRSGGKQTLDDAKVVPGAELVRKSVERLWKKKTSEDEKSRMFLGQWYKSKWRYVVARRKNTRPSLTIQPPPHFEELIATSVLYDFRE